jgi:hypothetical protein
MVELIHNNILLTSYCFLPAETNWRAEYPDENDPFIRDFLEREEDSDSEGSVSMHILNTCCADDMHVSGSSGFYSSDGGQEYW